MREQEKNKAIAAQFDKAAEAQREKNHGKDEPMRGRSDTLKKLKVEVGVQNDTDLPKLAEDAAQNDRVGRDMDGQDQDEQADAAPVPAHEMRQAQSIDDTDTGKHKFAKEVSEDKYAFDKPVFGINKIVPYDHESS